MSCGCNSGYDGGIYGGVCDTDTPYPSVSHESVPSLIDNLVNALYGTITKDVSSGKVVWNIPCDPNNTTQVQDVPRYDNEGLLCYMIRVFEYYINNTGQVTLDGIQTLTNKTLVSPTITGTGAIAGVFTGNVTGNVTGSSGSCTGNSATANIASNLGGTTINQIPYQSASQATSYIAVGTSGQKLIAGTAGLPAWGYDVAGVPAGATGALSGQIGQTVSGNLTTAWSNISSGSVAYSPAFTINAGDWDVQGWVHITFTGVTTVAFQTIKIGIGTSTTSFVNSAQTSQIVPIMTTQTLTPAYILLTPRCRFGLDSDTSHRVIVQLPTISAGSFTISNWGYNGRRVR
jgi:hypothetical protein